MTLTKISILISAVYPLENKQIMPFSHSSFRKISKPSQKIIPYLQTSIHISNFCCLTLTTSTHPCVKSSSLSINVDLDPLINPFLVQSVSQCKFDLCDAASERFSMLILSNGIIHLINLILSYFLSFASFATTKQPIESTPTLL